MHSDSERKEQQDIGRTGASGYESETLGDIRQSSRLESFPYKSTKPVTEFRKEIQTPLIPPALEPFVCRCDPVKARSTNHQSPIECQTERAIQRVQKASKELSTTERIEAGDRNLTAIEVRLHLSKSLSF